MEKPRRGPRSLALNCCHRTSQHTLTLSAIIRRPNSPVPSDRWTPRIVIVPHFCASAPLSCNSNLKTAHRHCSELSIVRQNTNPPMPTQREVPPIFHPTYQQSCRASCTAPPRQCRTERLRCLSRIERTTQSGDPNRGEIRTQNSADPFTRQALQPTATAPHVPKRTLANVRQRPKKLSGWRTNSTSKKRISFTASARLGKRPAVPPDEMCLVTNRIMPPQRIQTLLSVSTFPKCHAP